MKIEFITTRELKNADGESKGKVRIIKLKDDESATVEFTCPECGNSGKFEKAWAEPFVTGKGAKKKMHVGCPKCDYETTVLKLKKQIKKENKKKK